MEAPQTSPPAVVLVHGGQHTARCWEPTVAELARQAPWLTVLAVDLPGRTSRPGDPDTASIAGSVASVAQQVEDAGLQDVVLVGHSMAGIVLPGVATQLGAQRVRHLVFVACCVPPQGRSVIDTLSGPLRLMAARAARKGEVTKPMARWLATTFFCNGMSAHQKDLVLRQLCPEGPGPTAEPVDRSGLPDEIPRTWVLPTRDRSLSPKQQRGFIENLGGVRDVVEIDTCHDIMVSEPSALAEVLASRALSVPV